ncbi:hypothetical protein HPB49_004972 [Dermacentor silvarum]|uniref:Uncharacterized protein n=1 Tax=Dermacentor silvarum TaxID=543639 RepID=A0ACB8CVF9_DERSI|nr:hypothetical protein HPB49_004972 [Dermacentor silvarum]
MTSNKILEVAKKKRHLEHFFASLDEAMSAAQPLHKDLKLTASVCVLSSLVNERMEAFISPYFEAIKINKDGLVPALATQIALYWAFDIVFAPKAQKTFDSICRMVGINSGVWPTPLDEGGQRSKNTQSAMNAGTCSDRLNCINHGVNCTKFIDALISSK